MTDLTIHPAAEVFPAIDGSDFEELVKDIETHGLREPITPSREVASAFVSLLIGSADGIVRLRFLHDRDRSAQAHEREGTLAQFWPDVLKFQAQGYGVFYFMNEVKRGPGSGHGGAVNDADVERIRYLGIDCDQHMPDEWELHALAHLVVKTSVVGSAQRGQILWGVRDCPVDAFKRLQQRLAKHYGTDPQVCNPGRIFRLPGSLHMKGDPQLVTFYPGTADGLYPVEAIMTGVPELPAEETHALSPAKGEPVSIDHLRTLLKHIDPGGDRNPWRDIIAAIRATNAGEEDERLAQAEEWSSGWEGWDADAEAELEKIWRTMPPKDNGVAYGTILRRAEASGYTGGPYRKPSSEVFAPAIAELGKTMPAVSSEVSEAIPGSEDDLASLFADTYRNGLRHVAKWGKWFWFDGCLWVEVEEPAVWNHMTPLARDLVRRLDLSDTQRRGADSKRMIANAASLARGRLLAPVNQWDANLMALNTIAGIVNLGTGELHPADPLAYCTKSTAVAPAERGAPHPLWDRFLADVTAGNAELQSFLKRMAGYALTGSTKEHAMFFLYGTGSNGKGVFINTLVRILGDYATIAPIETFTETRSDRHPTELAKLRGARFVAAQEVEKDRYWAEVKVKSLTGGDPVSARFMRQDFFDYVPQFKLAVAGNHKPRLRTVDEAIRRRLHLIPFTVTIPEGKRDPELPDKLKAEWPAILRWAIEGCLEWQLFGLAAPAAVQSATKEYLVSQDPTLRWLEERCERRPDAWVTRKALYADYSAWAAREGEPLYTEKQFVECMESHNFKPSRRGKAGERGWAGVALKPLA